MAFVYEPIRRDQIRLIKFCFHDDKISAILQTFPLGSTPRYMALSYTWLSETTGDGRNHVLEIGDQQLPVLESLRSFFHVLNVKAPQFNEVWWWIDSLCIDLDNPEERAQQVQSMGSIYRNASQVVCWLGDDPERTDLVIGFIEHLSETTRQHPRAYEVIRSIFEQDVYNSRWDTLTRFFQRNWWTRIWTLQEYVIPSSLSFWYGTRTIDRADVEGAMLAADQCTALPIKYTPTFRGAWNRRRVRLHELEKNKPKDRTASCMSLTALAAYSSCFDATDDRDRLYGVRGIATDSSILDVDYALSVEQVYLRFAQSFIEHYRSLDIICFASIYSAMPGSSLPSWVPDWRTKADPLVIPLMVSQGSETHIGNFRPPSSDHTEASNACYASSGDAAAVYAFEGTKLITRGTILGRIDGLAGSRNTNMVQSSSALNSQSTTSCTKEATDISSDTLRSICRCLVLDRKDRYLRIAMPIEDFIKDFLWLCAHVLRSESSVTPVPDVQYDFTAWFEWAQDLKIRGQSIRTILGNTQEIADIIKASTGLGAPNQDEYVTETFFNRFFDTIVRMCLRLVVTDNGDIGLTTENAMKGDLVCVLFGCHVPVLLRQKSPNDHIWTFVGECFLDGFMNGECLGQPQFVEKEFHIQ